MRNFNERHFQRAIRHQLRKVEERKRTMRHTYKDRKQDEQAE
jgi:repressor of nif and glnA expression